MSRQTVIAPHVDTDHSSNE